MRRADAAAGLAERAVGGAGREVGLDRVERADLDALVAVDAGALDLPLGHAKQIAERKDRAARADILAPEPRLEEAQAEHGEEQRRARRSAPRSAAAPGASRACSAVCSGSKRNRSPRVMTGIAATKPVTSTPHSEQTSDAEQQVVLDMHPPAVVRHAEPRHAPADGPVEQIDQRAERAEVAAEAARNEHADQQNAAGEDERPDPRARGDRRARAPRADR